jgi:hypothetical protein
MKPGAVNHPIEILPAALLPQRAAWQGVARALPADGCLLVTQPDNQPQIALMLKLTRLWRRQGRQVVLWTAGRGRPPTYAFPTGGAPPTTSRTGRCLPPAFRV